MTLMKSRLKHSLFIFFTTCTSFYGGLARALDTFVCVRDLLPVTEPADFQAHRRGLEKPFIINSKYMVFPEVTRTSVAGFYIYSEDKAWYYDAVESEDANARPLAEFKDGDLTLYDLVAQPAGLETITLHYMPGFGVYRNSADFEEHELKRWIFDHISPKPSSLKAIEVIHKMLRLTANKSKNAEALWRPLNDELKFRKSWVRNHNLDEQNFKQFSRLLDSSCRE